MRSFLDLLNEKRGVVKEMSPLTHSYNDLTKPRHKKGDSVVVPKSVSGEKHDHVGTVIHSDDNKASVKIHATGGQATYPHHKFHAIRHLDLL